MRCRTPVVAPRPFKAAPSNTGGITGGGSFGGSFGPQPEVLHVQEPSNEWGDIIGDLLLPVL